MPNLGLEVNGRNKEIPNFLLLTEGVKCFLLSIVVKMLIIKNPITVVSLSYLTMTPTCIMITYSRNRTTLTAFAQPRSFGYQSARQYGLIEGSCTTNQETKECRHTQIETKENNKENNKQEENTPEE